MYLRIIERVLEAGQRALVLVPEIALTPQLVARFRLRFAVPVAVLHSSLADGRVRRPGALRRGPCSVVIGTRSAVFTPVPHSGSWSWTKNTTHRTSSRKDSATRAATSPSCARSTPAARRAGLGDALARVARERRGGPLRQALAARRTGARGPPRVTVVDLRVNPAQDGLSPPALAASSGIWRDGGQVLVFLNRRGYAPTFFAQLRVDRACKSCDARLTVHLSRATLACHHCGAEERMPSRARNAD